MNKLLPSLIGLLAVASVPAQAGDLDNIGALSQSGFQALSKDLTAALSYKPLQPADALGVSGFDLGVEMSATQLEHTAEWLAATGSDTDWLPMARLHVSKGLPWDVNIGGFYSQLPGSNIKLWGGELSYSPLPGGMLTPAVALRAAFTRLSGVDQLDFDSQSLEISVSKGFAMLTPYAGAGYVWGSSDPKVAGLVKESVNVGKVYAGLNLNLGTGDLMVEADKTGDNTSYSLKLGFRF